ncbi:MAG TPA: DUF2975 domain-containing protein [Chthoniobacterales bacterium]
MTQTITSAMIRQRSRKLRRIVTCLFVSLVVLLILERFGAVGFQLFEQGFNGDRPRRLALACITAFPEILYLLALWWIRQALAAFANGELFTPAVAQMLDRVGLMLATGAVITVFLLPSAAAALGFSPGYIVAYDVSSMVLGAIGLSLKIIAYILQRACEAQAELDEIF